MWKAVFPASDKTEGLVKLVGSETLKIGICEVGEFSLLGYNRRFLVGVQRALDSGGSGAEDRRFGFFGAFLAFCSGIVDAHRTLVFFGDRRTRTTSEILLGVIYLVDLLGELGFG